MKETKTRKEQIKLALIPLLLVVLAAVLFWPNSAPEGSARTPQLVTNPVKVGTPEKIASAGAGRRDDAAWPSLDLAQVAAVNPFAKSMAIKEMLGELPEEEPVAEAVATEGDAQAAATAAEPSEPPSALPAVPPAQAEPEIIDVATIATLQAIIDSDRGRSALINSRTFRVGDTLNSEYRIVEISPTAVFVEWIGPKENGESAKPSP